MPPCGINPWHFAHRRGVSLMPALYPSAALKALSWLLVSGAGVKAAPNSTGYGVQISLGNGRTTGTDHERGPAANYGATLANRAGRPAIRIASADCHSRNRSFFRSDPGTPYCRWITRSLRAAYSVVRTDDAHGTISPHAERPGLRKIAGDSSSHEEGTRATSRNRVRAALGFDSHAGRMLTGRVRRPTPPLRPTPPVRQPR
jgi:hypothetical protein